MWYINGQTHIGHKWEPYGSYCGFGPSSPFPANLSRIDFYLILHIFMLLSIVEDVKHAEIIHVISPDFGGSSRFGAFPPGLTLGR